MAQFYKELKDLRESRGISIEEISERTKINIQYLEDIELGNFGDIDTPYLRLFLRAYAEEIGGDSQRALEQLDSFMGTNPPAKLTNKTPEDEVEEELSNSKLLNNFKSNKKLRQDYLLAIFFSLVFIFSIFIFKKIYKEESDAVGTNNGPLIKQKIMPLNNEDLIKDYVKDQTSQEMLNVSPPFFVKFKTVNQIAYTFKNDTLPPVNDIINSNRELDLNPFVELSELIFTSTQGLTLFINGTELKQIAGYQYPMKLIINPTPPSLSIHRFKPIF